jgi:hypothetical protein
MVELATPKFRPSFIAGIPEQSIRRWPHAYPSVSSGCICVAIGNFNITAEELERRRETRIGVITQVAGPPLFIALLHGLQAVTNSLPWIAGQGNKTFACITKQHAVKPWIVDRDGVRIQSQIRKELTFFPIECVGFDREILRCAPAQVVGNA